MSAPIDVPSTPTPYTPPAGALKIDTVPAKVTVPAWNTVEYLDNQGNVIGHFDVPRQNAKDCRFAPDPEGAPYYAVFTAHPENAALADTDDFEGVA